MNLVVVIENEILIASSIWWKSYVGFRVGEKWRHLPITIVYGIAITQMAFFSDPTISTLTSGTISQSVDMSSLAFPRKIGVN